MKVVSQRFLYAGAVVLFIALTSTVASCTPPPSQPAPGISIHDPDGQTSPAPDSSSPSTADTSSSPVAKAEAEHSPVFGSSPLDIEVYGLSGKEKQAIGQLMRASNDPAGSIVDVADAKAVAYAIMSFQQLAFTAEAAGQPVPCYSDIGASSLRTSGLSHAFIDPMKLERPRSGAVDGAKVLSQHEALRRIALCLPGVAGRGDLHAAALTRLLYSGNPKNNPAFFEFQSTLRGVITKKTEQTKEIDTMTASFTDKLKYLEHADSDAIRSSFTTLESRAVRTGYTDVDGVTYGPGGIDMQGTAPKEADTGFPAVSIAVSRDGVKYREYYVPVEIGGTGLGLYRLDRSTKTG